MRPNNLLASTALTTSAVLVSGGAFAQPGSAPYAWTGCYVGLNAGAVIGHFDQSVRVPPPPNFFFSSSQSDTGFTGGGQAGCNWIFVPNGLLGIEGDINWADVSRSHNFGFTFAGEDIVGTQRTKLRWLSTVRARLGYLWNPSSLIFVTGGLAIGGVESSVDATQTDAGAVVARFAGSYSETRTGWTVGVGFEHAFTSRVTAKLEYLHFDLGDAAYDVTRISGPSATLPFRWQANAGVSGDIVRAGVNVRLGP